MLAEIATIGAFLIMALFLMFGLPALVRMYEHRLAHERLVLKQEEDVRQAEHKRSLELSEALRDPSPLELEVRKEEAITARYAAEARRNRR